MIEIRRGDKNQYFIALTIIFAGLSLIFFSVAGIGAAIVVALLYIPLILNNSKCIKMDQKGCQIKALILRRNFAWSDFQTVRMQDFSLECSTKNQVCYFSDEGIIFSKREIKKYPLRLSPDDYFVIYDPFCRLGFYIQFDPSKECSERRKLKKYSSFPYHVDREEFMALAEEWGLKIEGSNAPMPAELTKTKR